MVYAYQRSQEIDSVQSRNKILNQGGHVSHYQNIFTGTSIIIFIDIIYPRVLSSTFYLLIQAFNK